MKLRLHPFRALRFIWHWLDLDERDFQFYGGLALVAGGAWWIYPPAGLITFGVGLVWFVVKEPGSGRPG